MCPAHTGQLLASHAGVFRGARFRPSPQTPTQPRIIFLSNCFVRVVSDQSTVLKLNVDRLNTTDKLVVV